MAEKSKDELQALIHVPREKLAHVQRLITHPLTFDKVLVQPHEIRAIRVINPTSIREQSYDKPVPATPEKCARLLERAGTDKFRLVARVGGREIVSGQVFFNPVELITFYSPKAGAASERALAIPENGNRVFAIRPPAESPRDTWEEADRFNLSEHPEWIGLVHTRSGAKTPLLPEDRIYLPWRGLFSAEDLLNEQSRRGDKPWVRAEIVNRAIPLGGKSTRALE